MDFKKQFKKIADKQYFNEIVFFIVLLTINFTIGIQYFFLFMLAGCVAILVGVIFVWGMEVFETRLFGLENKTAAQIVGGIIGLIIYFLPLILELIG
tara:strand:+ start:167 stop:457 length:291 start_codon:yes stop_codon:yes gene_type:complete